MGMLAFLMVSTWRYRSFKDFNLGRPLSFKSLILFGSLMYLIYEYSRPVLFVLAITYMASGILIRIGGLWRRSTQPTPQTTPKIPETQVG